MKTAPRRPRRPHFRPAAVFLLGLLLAGCASAGPADERSRNRATIPESEMRTATAGNLYQVVEQLRPHWLRTRGSRSPYGLARGEDIVVYFGPVMQGGRDILRTVSPEGVAALRYLSGPEAQQRFGLGHRMGAIIVDFEPGR